MASASAPFPDDAARRDVLEEVDRLIAELETHPDAEVGERLHQLLEHIDTVHRTALAHLVAGIEGMAGQAFVNRLCADPAIRLLLMSYGLLAVDRRIVAEEALDAVRGHLHAHGVDVELVDVVGGVVYVRLHGLERSGADVAAVRRDLEEALRTGLVGFQELELGERASAGGLVQLGAMRRSNRPVYRDTISVDELKPGTTHAADLEGQPVLLLNVDGEVYAIGDACGSSPLPLRFGKLAGSVLTCSWHGCRYDVRSGRRLDEPDADRIAVFPVAVENGIIRVAIGVEPTDAAESTG